jgi:hypothetical protein
MLDLFQEVMILWALWSVNSRFLAIFLEFFWKHLSGTLYRQGQGLTAQLPHGSINLC